MTVTLETQDELFMAAPAPGFVLRAEDQQVLVDKARRAAKHTRRGRVMLQAETGSGKTVMGTKLAAEGIRQAAGNGKHVVWMAHRQELIDQAASSLAYEGISSCRWPLQVPGSVTLITAQARSCPEPGTTERLIVDEAQHSVAPTWHHKITTMKADETFGLSATPSRNSAYEGFDHIWDTMVCGPTYDQLVSLNALSPYHVVEAADGSQIKRSALERDEFGEFTGKSLTVEIKRLLKAAAVVPQWLRAVDAAQRLSNGDVRTLWFVPSVAAAHMMVEHLTDAGMTAKALTGDTKKVDRDRMMNGFRAGTVTHLVTVDIATEGLDVPECGIVVHMRTTTSVSLHRQINGRALRYAKNKTAIILDMAGNTKLHGTPDSKVVWSLRPRMKRTGEDREGVRSACPCCETPNWTAKRECVTCGAQLMFTCGGCHQERSWRQFADEYFGVRDQSECWECVEAVVEEIDWDSLLQYDANGQGRFLL